MSIKIVPRTIQIGPRSSPAGFDIVVGKQVLAWCQTEKAAKHVVAAVYLAEYVTEDMDIPLLNPVGEDLRIDYVKARAGS